MKLEPMAHSFYWDGGHTVSTAQYLEALVQAAWAQNHISQRQLSFVQQNIALLVALQAERKSMGHSDSIRVEEAESLLCSALYTLGIALRACSGTQQALQTLFLPEEAFSSLFRQGRVLIGRRFKTAQNLWRAAHNGRFATPNHYYNSTLHIGISAFFKLYDADYSAHVTTAILDYPLCLEPKRDTGVVFMLDYLEKLILENRFCRRFDPGCIHETLLRIYPDYDDQLINLFEPVLLAALGCLLAGQNPYSLSPQPKKLAAALKDSDPQKFPALLQATASRLCRFLDAEEGTALHTYICKAAKNTAPRLKASHRWGNSVNFFSLA